MFARRGLSVFFLACFLACSSWVQASKLLIPMDGGQANHLKAYGVAFWVLEQGLEVEWLLNYRGGSFLIPSAPVISSECTIRGVDFEPLADVQARQILNGIADPEVNQQRVKLEVAPKVAVYSPKSKLPWDDAVTMVLTFAEIPYDVVYDAEVMAGDLVKYDWLHLHHEDFTGQYGKFYRSYRNAAWYQEEQARQEASAASLGFSKVSEMKRAVALEMRNFVLGGGFLFTMCSGTDSFDIALAAQETDICEPMFDGDPGDPLAQQKLDFEQGFAFWNYRLVRDPMVYEFSDVDATEEHGKLKELKDFFTLFDFSAKWDV